MTEQEQFLKAIADAPWDDDSVRMVYSDWLLEHDQPEESERQRKIVPSERWLREIAEGCGISYRRLMDAAGSGDDIHMGDNEEYKDYYWGHKTEFWEHFEIVTGEKVVENVRENFGFSCSC